MKGSLNKGIRKTVRSAEKRAWKRGDCPTRGKMIGRKVGLIKAYFWD